MSMFPVILFTVLSLSSCSADSPSSSGTADTSATNEQTNSTQNSAPVKVVTLYSGLTNPWGMTWLPDGRLLITEKRGEILVFKDDKFTGEKISGVPKVSTREQGGLMDIQLHPNYRETGWIYFAYSKPLEVGAATAVMRAKLQGNQLVQQQELFVAGPALSSGIHYGSRISFDNEGYMYVVAGERGTNKRVQDLSTNYGKIHRLFDDGRVPTDNPFVNQDDAKPSIWTYGHRNPQGMAYDKENNRLWAVEHGPRGGDELNLIEKGKNYGWPLVTYGINYNGTKISDKQEMEGVQNPVKYWVPSPAPCGMALVTSDKYPGWKGNLLIANLAFRFLNRVSLDGTRFASEEKLMEDFARIRHVAQSPDGYIYVITEAPGKLVKLMPGS